jgi:hypothetical protein
MTAPAELLDRLLVASCELSPDLEAAKVIEVFLSIAADALPQTTIDVRLLRSDGSTLLIGPSSNREARESLEHERIIDVPGHQGTTLRLAARDRAFVFFDPPLETFLQRFVMTIGAALRRARADSDLRAKHALLHSDKSLPTSFMN